jgi:dolichyl-diphosphooligosaccharide--protein glycosyltransferase
MKNNMATQFSVPEGWRRAAYWAIFGLTLCVALWIRLDDLVAWHRTPQRAFHDNRPLLTTFDGYHYLAQARDLREGAYTEIDDLRGVPDSPRRPSFPPLIALMAAGLNVLTGVSLDWIGVLLPPILGLLLAVPLYLFGRLYGGGAMALTATFIGLCSAYYVYRSSAGWFDTDCMNVTFGLTTAYLFIQFGLHDGRRRFGYLAAGCACLALFLLWWDQSPTPVVIISLTPLAVAAALFYRPEGRERWLAAGVVLLVLILLLSWNGPQAIAAFFKKATGLFSYISKEQTGAFPNIGSSVFEQKPLDLGDLTGKTTGHFLPLLIGAAGLGLMFWRRRREAAPLGLLFLLGCFSFVYARRFLIFFNPFIAIGLGYAVQRLWDQRRRWPLMALAAPLLAVLACGLTVKNNLGKVYWPKEIPPIAAGIGRLAELSPPDAVAWAWWDHGYPVVYLGRRATINDGGVHSGLRTVCNAIPLAAAGERYAAAFMHFYVARGPRGLAELFKAAGGPARGMALLESVLGAGPDDAEPLIAGSGLAPAGQWREFFFPRQTRPIYLLLDLRLARTTYWWYWFGTWNVESRSGRHAKFTLLRGLRLEDGHILGPQVDIDPEQGRARYRGKSYRLGQCLITGHGGVRRVVDQRDGGLSFVFRQDEGVGALMEPAFAGTVFNTLFMRSDANSRYFTRVAERYPYYQIWKVASSERPFGAPFDQPALPVPTP